MNPPESKPVNDDSYQIHNEWRYKKKLKKSFIINLTNHYPEKQIACLSMQLML